MNEPVLEVTESFIDNIAFTNFWCGLTLGLVIGGTIAWWILI